MNFATIGASVWGFLKKIPDWVIWVIAAVVFLKFIDMRAERRGRDKQASETKVKQAEVKAAVVERSGEIIEEEQTNATEALAARDGGVHYPTASQLPDELASIGLRNRGGGPAS